jgi:hypothetical protein
VSRTRWVLGENYQIVKSPEKVRNERSRKLAMKYEIAKKLVAVRSGVQAEPNFTVEFQAGADS